MILIRVFKRKLISFFTGLGFCHQYRWHVDGPSERLIVMDESISEEDRKNKIGYVNTIFNTGSGAIHVGNHVIFGHNVMVLTGKHDFSQNDGINQKSSVVQGRDIFIGDGVWIASGALVLGGVTIGEHSVVMAGAVVTKNVPPHSIVAGVPAKVIKLKGL